MLFAPITHEAVRLSPEARVASLTSISPRWLGLMVVRNCRYLGFAFGLDSDALRWEAHMKKVSLRVRHLANADIGMAASIRA